MVEKSIMSVWLSLGYISFILAHTTSANIALNITRGGKDKFTNPKCVGDSTSCGNCDGGAACVASDCLECQCEYDTTFYLDSCVKNEEIAVSLDDNHSFQAYQYRRTSGNRLCMVPKVPNVTATTCDVADVKQRWIWTQHSQLLNVYTLKCLQAFDKQKIYLYVYPWWYPKVVLTSCNASDPRQTWRCITGRRGHLVYPIAYENDTNIKYLNFGNVKENIVILYTGTGNYSVWGRYMSTYEPLTLCSQVSSYHGCYKYSDGSSMLTIKTEDLKDCETKSRPCTIKKDISAPIEATYPNCSIQWEKTMFLNYSQWDNLPANVLEGKPLRLVKRDKETLTLKVDLKASRHLGGQILRLYIRCKSDDGLIKQDENETHCVLIKFSGSFRSLFSVHKMTELTEPSSTLPTITSQESLTGVTSRVTSTTIVPSGGHEAQTEGSSSTVVIAVVVCVILLFLVAAGIILFLFFKRGRCRMRKAKKTINNPRNEKSTAHSSVKSAETSNPVYAFSSLAPTTNARGPSVTSEGYEKPIERIVSRDCELYEPGAIASDCTLYESGAVTAGSTDSGLYEPSTKPENQVYFEPGAAHNTYSRPPASEITYDYAKPDGVNQLSSDNPIYEDA